MSLDRRLAKPADQRSLGNGSGPEAGQQGKGRRRRPCEALMMAAAPTGTVTFLFTDIESSTQLWEQSPDAMRSALARHDDIMRRAIDANGGYLFSTGGDGFAAAFQRTTSAVEAAAIAQRELGAQVWPGNIRLRVRIGIHTGECAERDGDYFGSTVNRAARLMGIAHGGQTVMSSAVQEILPPDVPVLDLGEHRLRDLAQPEHVFQLCDPGSDFEFPRLRSLEAYPTNLPVQSTEFVGRGVEMAELEKALAESRMVTLTGVGGVGKTRLAVQVAARCPSELPGWCVDRRAGWHERRGRYRRGRVRGSRCVSATRRGDPRKPHLIPAQQAFVIGARQL